MLATRVGTPGFMAPEILAELPYEGSKVDLFAIGVALFILYRGRPPFENARPNDPIYRLFV